MGSPLVDVEIGPRDRSCFENFHLMFGELDEFITHVQAILMKENYKN